ncbi:MAG TPA: chloride channel protein [Gemmatimonadales bacterium]|nr:chloride channel protein [Gemmatimonadales bacterium]
MAIAFGAAFAAQLLTGLIGFITNLSFYGRLSTDFVTPWDNHLGPLVIGIPVVGALIVGVMARYGSAAIRGHGIPEAMEQVLLNESRIPARITLLKPLSAAIAIGTGGPFGAEGPIIATGGALGSVLGQILHTTAAERKEGGNRTVKGIVTRSDLLEAHQRRLEGEDQSERHLSFSFRHGWRAGGPGS